MMKFFCCDKRRQNAVERSTLNGIDFLEVDDDLAKPDDQRQRRLFVHFLKPLSAGSIAADNIRIEGGELVRNFRITILSGGVSEKQITLELDHPGDASIYTLRLVGLPSDRFDPMLSMVDFSFKVNCRSNFDCRDEDSCPPEMFREPDLDYLAKDFESFRQLMLDRLSLLIPDWRERNLADLMQVLVDWKAYIADYQSYQQDAVATESYLGTARKRTSVRRHARLVDYFMHDGCNARVWIQVRVKPNVTGAVKLPAHTQVLTQVSKLPEKIEAGSPEYRRALEQEPPIVFETMHEATLFAAHNAMRFYTWGDDRCCLPKGAVTATLHGEFPRLREGDVLIFEEVRGPETGSTADVDRSRRHPVRLVGVTPGIDRVPDPALPVTEIRWHEEDALPFPLCISISADKIKHDESGPAFDLTLDPTAVTLVRGNIVLADHGLTLSEERLENVPAVEHFYAIHGIPCKETPPRNVPVRYRPRLNEGPVSQTSPAAIPFIRIEFHASHETDLNAGRLPSRLASLVRSNRVVIEGLTVEQRGTNWNIRNGGEVYVVKRETINGVDSLTVYDYASAKTSSATLLRDALPAVVLTDPDAPSEQWTPKRDLLNSVSTSKEFVVEVEASGETRLRFGDDVLGQRPTEKSKFQALYRVGNGPSGNVGAESIRHIVSGDEAIDLAWNPLPAQGGTHPESIAQVRRDAPYAYHVQERAVTPEDYATIAQRHSAVQRAVARFRWTGSWYTVFLMIDRFGGKRVDEDDSMTQAERGEVQRFRESMRRHMERYRMTGYDLEVQAPLYVPLDVAMEVCASPDYFREHVEAQLRRVFTSRTLPDGQRGFFHPDNFSFGQTVYLSRLYAAAQNVPGVASVRITVFQRLGDSNSSALDSGKLPLGPLEIARLDHDKMRPDSGRFSLQVRGGK